MSRLGKPALMACQQIAQTEARDVAAGLGAQMRRVTEQGTVESCEMRSLPKEEGPSSWLVPQLCADLPLWSGTLGILKEKNK